MSKFLGEQYKGFLKNLKIEIPYDPAIPLLGIYPEKTMIWKDTCTPVVIPLLCTIAKTWQQPKCLPAGEWIKKIWYTHAVECYSAIKKNEIMTLAATWMDLDLIIRSEINQRNTNIIGYHLYVESNQKKIQMNLYAEQK